MTKDPSPEARDVQASQTGIAAGEDVNQQAGRDAVGRDRIEIVVNPPPVDTAAALDNEQRARFTEQVRRWYRVRLSQALDRVVRLELGLDTDAAAVVQPLDRFMPRDCGVQPLPAGTTVLDVFTIGGGEQGGLLILGDPGAGKTTMLFDLAVALTAESDTSHRTPVYLALSTWQQQRRPLAEWLAGQLNEVYFVPPKTAARWVQTGRVLPLLDGLDEIDDPEARTACVVGINQFRRQFSWPVVVCSRRLDYQALPLRLALEAAVLIRPLDPAAVLEHLRQAGRPLAGVRAVLREDPDLLEFCRSPLLLSILILTYHGQPATQLRAEGSPEQRRERLFNDYVGRRLDHLTGEHGEAKEGYHAGVKRQHTVRWLGALAHNLNRHEEKVLLLERLQPDWVLVRRPQRLAFGFGFIPWLFLGLSAGVLLGITGLLEALHVRLVELGATWLGVLVSLLALLGLIDATDKAVFGVREGRLLLRIRPTEQIVWSWRRALPPWPGAARGVRVAVLMFMALMALTLPATIGVVASRPRSDPAVAAMRTSIAGWLAFTLAIVLSLGLTNGFQSGEIAQSIRPNQGIRNSLKYGLKIYLGVGLMSGVISGLAVGMIFGLQTGFAAGLSVGWLLGSSLGFSRGLCAVLQHGFLRFLLWRHHVAPLRYVAWLEEMVRARLMYRVGGGYEFVHGLLRDYFERRSGYQSKDVR